MRLLETLPWLACAGIEPIEDIDKSRKLAFDTNRSDMMLLVYVVLMYRLMYSLAQLIWVYLER